MSLHLVSIVLIILFISSSWSSIFGQRNFKPIFSSILIVLNTLFFVYIYSFIYFVFVIIHTYFYKLFEVCNGNFQTPCIKILTSLKFITIQCLPLKTWAESLRLLIIIRLGNVCFQRHNLLWKRMYQFLVFAFLTHIHTPTYCTCVYPNNKL